MKKIKILDCTLRDGGFYNNWDFDLAESKKLVIALNKAGVDLIELGYKSPNSNQFYGLFKYCNEDLLSFVREYNTSEYAFMIDAKEFIKGNAIDVELLDAFVLDQDESIFSWVRIASRAVHAPLAPDFIRYFKEKGYKVCFNLMGGSMVTDEEIVEVLNILEGKGLDVFYIADSYGSFYPNDVRQKMQLIKANYEGQTGVHLHDNQGLAYANAIIAIEEGADVVDATIMGMGRGAGNLILEQFLLGYREKYNANYIEPDELLPSINNYFKPLKEQHNWGFNYTYMLSGINNIHQSYCQLLSQENRFTMSQVSEILSEIPVEKRAGFSAEALETSVKKILERAVPSNGRAIPAYTKNDLTVKEVLIVAGGPSVKRFSDVIHHFIKDRKVQLLECNHTKVVDAFEDRTLLILNKLKLEDYLEQHKNHPMVITGEANFSGETTNDKNVFRIPFSLGEFNLDGEEVSIPDYDAGMFSIAYAMNNGAQKIYLAGFDGFEEEEKNKRMEHFFQSIQTYINESGIEIQAITPSRYKNLAQTSIYALL